MLSKKGIEPDKGVGNVYELGVYDLYALDIKRPEYINFKEMTAKYSDQVKSKDSKMKKIKTDLDIRGTLKRLATEFEGDISEHIVNENYAIIR